MIWDVCNRSTSRLLSQYHGVLQITFSNGWATGYNYTTGIDSNIKYEPTGVGWGIGGSASIRPRGLTRGILLAFQTLPLQWLTTPVASGGPFDHLLPASHPYLLSQTMIPKRFRAREQLPCPKMDPSDDMSKSCGGIRPAGRFHALRTLGIVFDPADANDSLTVPDPRCRSRELADHLSSMAKSPSPR